MATSSSRSTSSSSNSGAGGGVLDSLIASLISTKQDLTLSEKELDKLISDAILQEVRSRNQGQPSTSPSHSLTPDPTKAASTNKRFLAGVIKGVEGHNAAVLKRGLREALRGEKDRRNKEHRRASHRDDSRAGPTSSSDGTGRRSSKTSHQAASSPQLDRPGPFSKMDKYFSPAYDPSLDIAPEYSTHQSSSEVGGQWGLIEDGGFDALLDRSVAVDQKDKVLVGGHHHARDKGKQRERERERRSKPIAPLLTSPEGEERRKIERRRTQESDKVRSSRPPDASQDGRSHHHRSSQRDEMAQSYHRRHRRHDPDFEKRGGNGGDCHEEEEARKRHRHPSKRRRDRSPTPGERSSPGASVTSTSRKDSHRRSHHRDRGDGGQRRRRSHRRREEDDAAAAAAAEDEGESEDNDDEDEPGSASSGVQLSRLRKAPDDSESVSIRGAGPVREWDLGKRGASP